MADDIRKWTDEELKKMESHIRDIYSDAQKDITAKWDSYFSRATQRLSGLQNDYDNIKSSGDEEAVKEAYNALEKAKRNITFKNEQYEQMLNKTTTALANANQTALEYVNGKMPKIYTKNYNDIKKDVESFDVNFSIVDEATVKKLIKDGDITLPKKKVEVPKDKRWNTKQLNSSVLQGILQGESMDKIAKRILPVVDNNANAAIRNARTMVTGAENSGRLDSYKELEEEGVVMKKVWIATPDDRTREAHLFMDGQEVDIDEPFVDGDGNKLDYPGDPTAEPETVYNCRCSMKTHIVGFRKADGSVKKVDYEEKEQSLHEKQIEEEKETRGNRPNSGRKNDR